MAPGRPEAGPFPSGPRTALLLCDFQNGLLGGLEPSARIAIEANAMELRRVAEANGWTVIYTLVGVSLQLRAIMMTRSRRTGAGHWQLLTIVDYWYQWLPVLGCIIVPQSHRLRDCYGATVTAIT